MKIATPAIFIFGNSANNNQGYFQKNRPSGQVKQGACLPSLANFSPIAEAFAMLQIPF